MKIIEDFLIKTHLRFEHTWEQCGLHYTIQSAAFNKDASAPEKFAVFSSFLREIDSKKSTVK